MIIDDYQLYHYQLPFNQPITMKGQTHTHREGFIIAVGTNMGIEGFGEIAPLPGFSKESLKDVFTQLTFLKDNLINTKVPDFLENLNGECHQWLGEYDLYPSVQFGIEMAMLNLKSNAQRCQINKLISPDDNHDAIRVNGLLQGSIDDVTTEAQKLLAEGYTAMKLKIGGDVKNDVQKTLAVNQIIQGKALLHGDANRAWNLEQAKEFVGQVSIAVMDYIEEPLNDMKQIPEFFHETYMICAFDETVQERPLNEITGVEGVDILVLKPTLIGGIEKTWQIMEKAKKCGLQCVNSSSYESSLGIFTLANIAGCSARDKNAGLDTLKHFQKNLLVNPLSITQGKLNIHQRVITRDQIDFSLLKPVRL